MKIKKTLVTILLVFVLAISSTVFIACDDVNSLANTGTVTLDSAEFESIINSMVGFIVANENSHALLRFICDDPQYGNTYFPPEILGKGLLGQCAIYFDNINAEHQAEKTAPYLNLLLYETEENANIAKPLVENSIAQSAITPCTFSVDRNLLIIEYENNAFSNIKSSSVSPDKLNETQLSFIKETIKSSFNDYLFNDITFLCNEANDKIFHIFTVLSTETIREAFFYTDIETYRDEANNYLSKIGTIYTNDSYVYITDNGIFMVLIDK